MGLFPSQSRAKAEILEGNVIVDDRLATKAGKFVDGSVKIEVKKKDPYVSRGAHKLIRALDEFEIDLENKICCDLGASTGGFTHVMLERGAKRVYAVDVGYGQFAWRLRKDPRVDLMERTNARFLKPDDFDLPIDFVSCDLSFISLKHILPVIKASILRGRGEAICLVKPQFEAGRERLKKGVVRYREVHESVLEEITLFARKTGFSIGGLTHSPIKGPAGNIEFLMELRFENDLDFDLHGTVDSAWNSLEGKSNVDHR